ncbi:MAG: MucR family transcriptional regulator [Magnetococcus sp. WYHC-3]
MTRISPEGGMPMQVELIKQTARIVESYVGHNAVAPEKLPELIRAVHGSLSALGARAAAPVATAPVAVAAEAVAAHDEEPRDVRTAAAPAASVWTAVVSVEESVTPNEVFCMICGQGFKALKGHLSRSHNMSCDEYRRRFSLPRDHLLVAPNYSTMRRSLAKEHRLGEKMREGRRKAQ